MKNSLSHFNYSGNLKGQLLVASPLLYDSIFEKAVVYICAHSDQGAMGLLVNHLIGDLSYSNFIPPAISELEAFSKLHSTPLHFGGPVEYQKGFILHTSDYYKEGTYKVGKDFSITSTVDILNDISSNAGPRKSLVAVGCAVWTDGQLEEEISQGLWMTAPAREEILFATDDSKKWQKSIESLGINLAMLSGDMGHA